MVKSLLRFSAQYYLGDVLRNKKYVVLGISLIAIIIIVTPLTYLVAFRVVSDAAVRLGFDSYSGSIHTGLTGVSFASEFIFANSANIPLTIDRVNITIFVYSSSPYDGSLNFMGPPGLPDAIYIGSVVGENKIVPANGQVGVSATFDVTSEDALDLIHSGNYSVGGSYRELTVSGSFLFWHITPQIAFQ